MDKSNLKDLWISACYLAHSQNLQGIMSPMGIRSGDKLFFTHANGLIIYVRDLMQIPHADRKFRENPTYILLV